VTNIVVVGVLFIFLSFQFFLLGMMMLLVDGKVMSSKLSFCDSGLLFLLAASFQN